MRCLPAAIFLSLAFAARAVDAPPNPRQQMASEMQTLRAAQIIAFGTRQAPPTDEEIAATSRIYRDLIRRFPKEDEPHVAFGEFLHSVDRNEQAFSEWQQALALNPARHDVLAAEADLLVQTGQIVAATDAFEKAAALSPTTASYQFGLAHLYTMFRNDLAASRHASTDELITRGTRHFRRASELAPENPTYLQAYAEAFYTQPKPDWTLARAAWETLLPRSDNKDFVQSHLVRVNIRLRDKAAAREHLAQLTNPAFTAMKASLQKQIDAL